MLGFMEKELKKPPWLKRRLGPPGRQAAVSEALKDCGLHTVCSEALCPNQPECYGRGTATFLLLGPTCTRRCTFCAVDKTEVHPVDPDEPARTAQAALRLELDFCVLTMVTRDDLPDGGAAHVAQTIKEIRKAAPEMGVEVLISDLGGEAEALSTVLSAAPEVLNHNIETVPRLYPEVRPQADYERSLRLLARAAAHRPRLAVKSGLMLGLGETRAEILAVMDDLRQAGCRLLTLGQYLAPSARHHPIRRYVPPEEFEELEREALDRGFSAAASAPLVRSSYQAGRLFAAARQALDREDDLRPAR